MLLRSAQTARAAARCGARAAWGPTVPSLYASSSRAAAASWQARRAAKASAGAPGSRRGGFKAPELEPSSMYQQPKLYDEVFSYRDFDAEAAFVRAAYKRHCPGRPLGALLELGCGPARHAALLAKAGGRLWALDASEPMLAYARQLAQDAGADVTFVQGDMAGFDIEGQEAALDLVMILLGTFSHMTTNDQAVGAFRSIAKHLRPGGMLLLELAHPGDLFDGSLVIGDEGGEMWEAESESQGCQLLVEWGAEGDDFDPATQVLRRTVAVRKLEGGEPGEALHESVVLQRSFTLQEIDLLGRLAGLRVAGVYGDLDLKVGLNHEEAYRLVVCLVKGEE